MKLTFPDNTREVINEIRKVIGREVTFYTETSSACPACSGVDEYTGYSLNPFCIVCSGTGLIKTVSGVDILAHVSWGTSEDERITRGGVYEFGNCTIQIEYTEENKNLVNNAAYIIVDGKKVIKRDVIYRGVPTLNRIIIGCSVKEN